MIIALSFTTRFANEEYCRGLTIVVNDSTSRRFVTSAGLAKELGSLPTAVRRMRLKDVNTDSIRRFLEAIDKIERVSVVKMTDHTVRITVDPMIPVARVFDNGQSYYINREGKRISANPRYHIDVPVIQGHFVDSVFPPTELLSLIEYIAEDSVWNPLMSMIKVDSPTDIIYVPIIRGQVVNLGGLDNIESKFARLRRFYSEVLPVKGWNYYDTISVKWGGQIVATRRHKKLPAPDYVVEEDEEAVDVGTMLAAEGVAPGRTRIGQKAHSEKPIPAATTAFAKREANDRGADKESDIGNKTESGKTKHSSNEKNKPTDKWEANRK